MKAAMFFNVPVVFDGHRYTGVHTRQINAFGELAHYFDELLFLLPVKYQSGRRWPLELKLQWRNTRIVALPYFAGDDIHSRDGLVKLPLVLPTALLRIFRAVRQSDVIGATVPSLLGNLTSALALVMGKPVFHYVRGDKEATLSAIYSEGWTHALFKVGSAALESYVRWALCRRVPTFVVGSALLEKYSGEVPTGGLLRVAAPVLTGEFAPPPGRWNRVPNRENARLLYVGRLSPEKGVHVLLQALALLRDQHGVEYEAGLVGDGPERLHLEKLAERLALSRVKFAGLIPHGLALARFYQDADVLIVPSLAEGLGAVIAEAMACGLPVVASDVGGISTIVKHGSNGLLVSPNAPEKLAEAILHLLSSPDMWERFSRTGVKTAGWYKVDHQMQGLLDGVIAHYRLPPRSHEIGLEQGAYEYSVERQV